MKLNEPSDFDTVSLGDILWFEFTASTEIGIPAMGFPAESVIVPTICGAGHSAASAKIEQIARFMLT
ncbi:MAG TPA: hypothetical protein VJP76_02095 [Candidatus Tumulicola sp.]|nr:hypothetical protein [Candidatus Tumulicola sp.]